MKLTTEQKMAVLAAYRAGNETAIAQIVRAAIGFCLEDIFTRTGRGGRFLVLVVNGECMEVLL